MDDYISRQALCQYALNQKDKSVTPNDIMRFPSAEPEKRTEERTETHSVCLDVIDRQAAIEMLDEQIALCDKALKSFGISMKDEYAVKVERASLVAYKEQLEFIPAADVVPVVRCRECKHCIASRQGKLFCIHGFEQTIISAFVAIDNPIFERELDSFCSYGEQR